MKLIYLLLACAFPTLAEVPVLDDHATAVRNGRYVAKFGAFTLPRMGTNGSVRLHTYPEKQHFYHSNNKPKIEAREREFVVTYPAK